MNDPAGMNIGDDAGSEFRIANLDDPRIVNLLATHARLALSGARCRQGHALDVQALRDPEIEVWSLWLDDGPVAVGAIRRLSPGHGELKSMFVIDAARGKGLGRVLLERLIEVAQRRNMKRLSLETGASDYFEAARRLYASHGFEVCAAFADLPPHPDSVFMTLVCPVVNPVTFRV